MVRLGIEGRSINSLDEFDLGGHTFLESKIVWSRMDARAAKDPEGATPCDPMPVDRRKKVRIENKQVAELRVVECGQFFML